MAIRKLSANLADNELALLKQRKLAYGVYDSKAGKEAGRVYVTPTGRPAGSKPLIGIGLSLGQAIDDLQRKAIAEGAT
jgi:hypothetical protein